VFKDQDLLEKIKVENTLQIESLILGEWNLNNFENIFAYGNYRYRPETDSIYSTLPNTFDPFDEGDYYTDALISNKQSEYTVDNNEASLLFSTPEVDRELYFSLKECFQPFRPRSGINKVLWFSNKYIDNIKSARRPRYYLSSRYDKFKYWNSYRKENGSEYGISDEQNINDIGYRISDAAPFVVYTEPVAANRIVVKMQTNLAETNGGEIRTINGLVEPDPLSNLENSSIPERWKIQYLDQNNSWIDAISFDETSLRRDGSEIINWDGHVEIYYGIRVPEEYRDSFNFVTSLSSSAQLPSALINGESYLIGANESSPGELYVWNFNFGKWDTFEAEYGFSLLEDDDTKRIGIVNNLVGPKYFELQGIRTYREVAYLKGIRIVAETMKGPDKTFDIIEISPRLKANLSDYVLSYEINKSLARPTVGIPVGGLSTSIGQVSIMNFDGAFNENNKESLIYNQLKPNVKFEFYEIVLNVNGFDKFIPIKTMYTEEFPIAVGGIFEIDVRLRDFFFRLETTTAPTILLSNTTLTKAVAVLLDSIGFSNYVFAKLETDNDPVIPYFFVEPDVSVAEILNRLSIATQTAMFFDEYNNFVVMSKEYLMPKNFEREEDYVLYSEKNNGVLPNIINLEGIEKNVINSGQINYVTRYIQRSAATLSQASKTDEERTYIYKPVLLWEVGTQEETKTINEKTKQVGYVLGSVALNSTLTQDPPTVVNKQIINNTIDLGENIYWLPRFQGYLYANGEIIRYDAVEYAIPSEGIVWIKSNQEYQKYFSNLPFNGKIYPTGNIRIYTEPFYEEIEGAINEELDPNVVFKDGEVRSHGRGQFGTGLVEHSSGLPSYWSDNNNVRGVRMASQFLFTTVPTEKINKPTRVSLGPTVGKDDTSAQLSLRTGILANFMRQNIPGDDVIKNLKSTASGTVQSSAFIFGGPNPLPSGILNRDFVSYVYKEMDQDFKHFGTRVRIIGKPESNEKILTPQNAFNYYSVEPQGFNDSPNITGGSGGIAAMVNPEKNYGYFFEIISLTGDNLQRYTLADAETEETISVLHNIVFYKVAPGNVDGQVSAVPYKLWGGLGQILVDEGKFVGQDRVSSQSKPTVYDLAIEYENIANTRRFYLYLNNSLIATVDDTDPLPAYNNIALFTRGASKCMFENVYALKNLQSQETTASVINSISNPFQESISSSEALRKYAISGLVQSTYLSGIKIDGSPQYSIYFEEFGTIMRECAYFNIKYDQAYPAFLAFLAPTFNNERTYTVSGFRAGSYGAEFLIFNNTDKAIVLDETSGSYLRIIGVTFTQNTSNILTVDDYFKETSSFSDPVIINNTIKSPLRADKLYDNIKLSRSRYGEKDFSLESPYIQSDDLARNIMEWMIDKTLSPKKILFMEVFGGAHLQLGDLIKINYKLPDGDILIDEQKRFVISEIFYSRSTSDLRNRITVLEV
jgi:hypothetical protein